MGTVKNPIFSLAFFERNGYTSVINNKFALNGEDLMSDALNFMYEAIYNPYLENGVFSEEYVKGEKETLREIIKGKINNKGSYAMFRCTEEMFGENPYALFKYGVEEDLEAITAENLYERYKELLETSEKHFYVCGDVNEEDIKSFFCSKFAEREASGELLKPLKHPEKWLSV